MPKGRYNRTHHGGGQNKGGGGGGNNGGGGNKKKNKSLAALSTITSTSSGKDLVKLARAMAKVEVKPQIRAYRRLVKELKGQQAADTIGLQRLGQQTQKDIAGAANAYDVGAQGATNRTQAIGGLLQGQLASQGQQAAQSQQTAQTGVLGGLQQSMAATGAPGGGAAQAALGQLVAQQNARQAAETQAGQQFATAQQGQYGSLMEGMRTSGALQASTSRQQVGRDIASRIAETRLQSGQDIREAMGKKGDVKATKGSLMLEKLAELRAAERDYDLGRRATRSDRSIAAGAQATTRRGQDIQADTAAANRAADEAAREDEQQHDIELEHQGDVGEPSSRGAAGHPDRQARKKEAKTIANLAREQIQLYGNPADANHPETAYARLKKYLLDHEGIGNPTLVDRVLKKLTRSRGGGSPPGAGSTPGPI